MSKQVWSLTCRISGNFFLVDAQDLASSHPPFASLRKLSIAPEFNKDNAQTGIFALQIDFVVDAQGPKPAPNVVADEGRDILNYFLDILAFLSGHRVMVIGKPPEMTYNYPSTKKFRRLFFPTHQANLPPPVPLANTSLFSARIDQKVRRTLTWVRKGLQEDDVVDSFISLCTSLEMLASQMEFKGNSVRKCRNCGHETVMDASMKQRVEHFLVMQTGCSQETSQSIWDTRNRITHGGFIRSAENQRELHRLRGELLLAIVRGMKRLLRIGGSEPPFEQSLSCSFADPILDIEYAVPDEQGESNASPGL